MLFENRTETIADVIHGPSIPVTGSVSGFHGRPVGWTLSGVPFRPLGGCRPAPGRRLAQLEAAADAGRRGPAEPVRCRGLGGGRHPRQVPPLPSMADLPAPGARRALPVRPVRLQQTVRSHPARGAAPRHRRGRLPAAHAGRGHGARLGPGRPACPIALLRTGHPMLVEAALRYRLSLVSMRGLCLLPLEYGEALTAA
jgi:hypothetical protein